MSQKRTKKKSGINIPKSSVSKKKKKKNKGVKYVVIIAILLAVALLIINPNPYKNPEPKPNKTTGPVFKKEGELTIYKTGVNNSELNIDIEIADNNFERAQGLMYRRTLGKNKGMFFIMESEETQSFWMKNTYISLDIIYLNRDQKINSIHKYTQPMSEAPVLSSGKAKYVLEVDAGFCDTHGISIGDSIAYIR